MTESKKSYIYTSQLNQNIIRRRYDLCLHSGLFLFACITALPSKLAHHTSLRSTTLSNLVKKVSRQSKHAFTSWCNALTDAYIICPLVFCISRIFSFGHISHKAFRNVPVCCNSCHFINRHEWKLLNVLVLRKSKRASQRKPSTKATNYIKHLSTGRPSKRALLNVRAYVTFSLMETRTK